MRQTLRTGGAGLLLTLVLVAPAAAAPPSVSVRVEGERATLLPRTPVTPPDAPDPRSGCPADSAANALSTAVKGDWDGKPYAQTILGETHAFANSDYWGVWVFRGGRYQVTTGICDERLNAGEELLAAFQVAPEPTYAPRYFPMWLEGVPASVAPGAPLTVTVAQTACETCNPGEGRRTVREGATLSAGTATATSDAEGRATVTLTERGPVTLRATAPGATPTATETTCVTDGADGFCNTAKPGEPAPVAAPSAPPCATSGDDGRCGTRDRRAAQARITGIEEGQRFARRRAPRKLTATVESDPSGLRAVKLGLSREHRGRCSVLSGRTDSFRPDDCGDHPVFVVGDEPEVSYLLPRRLPRGRYVLDVVAIDGAFNRDTLARGRNRVVFTVR